MTLENLNRLGIAPPSDSRVDPDVCCWVRILFPRTGQIKAQHWIISKVHLQSIYKEGADTIPRDFSTQSRSLSGDRPRSGSGLSQWLAGEFLKR